MRQILMMPLSMRQVTTDIMYKMLKPGACTMMLVLIIFIRKTTEKLGPLHLNELEHKAEGSLLLLKMLQVFYCRVRGEPSFPALAEFLQVHACTES